MPESEIQLCSWTSYTLRLTWQHCSRTSIPQSSWRRWTKASTDVCFRLRREDIDQSAVIGSRDPYVSLITHKKSFKTKISIYIHQLQIWIIHHDIIFAEPMPRIAIVSAYLPALHVERRQTKLCWAWLECQRLRRARWVPWFLEGLGRVGCLESGVWLLSRLVMRGVVEKSVMANSNKNLQQVPAPQ